MIEVTTFDYLSYNTKLSMHMMGQLYSPCGVISSALKDLLYQKNLHNVIRLISVEEFFTDSKIDSCYKQSETTFRQWQNKEVLVSDSELGYYLYNQEFEKEIFLSTNSRFPSPRQTTPIYSMLVKPASTQFLGCIHTLIKISRE
jgi:hypothetical protein